MTDALGQEPDPMQRHYLDEMMGMMQMVRADYADYWRRRALAAEALLREALKAIGAEPVGDEWDRLRARVAAHFDQVKP